MEDIISELLQQEVAKTERWIFIPWSYTMAFLNTGNWEYMAAFERYFSHLPLTCEGVEVMKMLIKRGAARKHALGTQQAAFWG